VSVSKNDKLRAAREATPSRRLPGRAMARSELAELVVEHVWRRHGVAPPVDRKYVAKLEAGRIRYPSARYREALRAVLGAGADDDLGFVSANQERAAKRLAEPGDHRVGVHLSDEQVAALVDGRELTPETARLLREHWLPGPPEVAGWAPAPRIGPELVTIIHDRARTLHRLDADPGAAEPVARELLGALAELCQTAGWLAGDGGRRTDATRYYRAGLRAAHAVGDDALRADLFSSLAALETGAGPAALTRRRCTASPRLLALVGGRVAWTKVSGPRRPEAGADAEDNDAEDTGAEADGPAPWLRRDRAEDYAACADRLADERLGPGDVDAAVGRALAVLARARTAPARRVPEPRFRPVAFLRLPLAGDLLSGA
jgi:hypothetical protein